MILAGDIGGTNARLAWFDFGGREPKVVDAKVYPSARFSCLDDIAAAFVAEYPQPITSACFAVPAPVEDQTARTPNLPWEIDARSIARGLGIADVRLLNDLEAAGYGITLLKDDDLVVLNPGRPRQSAPAAIIAAGTGLGQVGLIPDGGGYRPVPSEGGHADFAPQNDIQTALLSYLLERFDHVSVERVVSGPGLHNVFRFLVETARGSAPEWLVAEVEAGDPPAVISKYGLAGEPTVCADALNLFVSAYGAEAGNMALRYVAAGGMFVAGGIAPKIAPILRKPLFLQSFVAKGRMKPFLERVPVKLVLNDNTALLGAARIAARMAGDNT